MSAFRAALVVGLSLGLGGAALAQATYSSPPPVVKREKEKCETAAAGATADAPKAKQRRKCRRDTTNAADGPLGRMVCEGDEPKDGPSREDAQKFLLDRQNIQR